MFGTLRGKYLDEKTEFLPQNSDVITLINFDISGSNLIGNKGKTLTLCNPYNYNEKDKYSHFTNNLFILDRWMCQGRAQRYIGRGTGTGNNRCRGKG